MHIREQSNATITGIKRFLRLVAITSFVTVLSGSSCQPPGVVLVGTVLSDEIIYGIADMSGDGSVLVGTMPPAEENAKRSQAATSPAPEETRAYRWTAQSGVEPINNLEFLISQAHAVSGNGSVVVGYAHKQGDGFTLFRWTRTEGMHVLSQSSEENRNPTAADLSSDGSVIVGKLGFSANHSAFRWTQQDGYSVIDVPGLEDEANEAVAVSDDGHVIVIKQRTGDTVRAYRWTADTGSESIDDSTDESTDSTPYNISGDGRVIVGRVYREYSRPFRWTQEEGIVLLDPLPNHPPTGGVAFCAAFDGTVIAGTISIQNEEGSNESVAVIWDPVHGCRTVQSLLSTEDAAKLEGWTLSKAELISNDGLTVAGTGKDPNGKTSYWVVRLSSADFYIS